MQVPTTLPTYDELAGRQCTIETYNGHLLNMIHPDQLNVLTIHAEIERIACLELFKDFPIKAQQRNIAFAPLGDILAETGKAGKSSMFRATLAGRDGWLACQDGMDMMEIHNKVSKR